MPAFEEKYIYCSWDDILAGKEIFFADDVVNLQSIVKYNVSDYKDVLKFSGYEEEPFKSAKFCNTNWKFAYYDPDYKFLADDDSKRLVTNRELAMWLSKGNGEICMSDIKLTYHQYEKDDELVTDILVRKWCDDGWHKPTRQYLGLGD